MDDFSLTRFSRHLMLNEIDIARQQTLMNARILVVGCGGLGANAIPLLAASGIGTLILCDADRVELSNLQRQTAYCMQDLGRLKVEAAADAVRRINPAVKVESLPVALDAHRLPPVIHQIDVVLDCSDNAPTRHAINRATVAARIPLVSGAVSRFEGQLAVFDPRLTHSPCYACLFGTGAVRHEHCATTGIFAPLVSIIGALQAAEAMKLIMHLPHSPVGRLITYDALTLKWREWEFERDPACSVCAPLPQKQPLTPSI